MFENKPASFYTSYFNNNSSFAIKEEFKESEDEKEKDLYVGYVEVLNTIHELILRVEIPKSFPYQHLIFRTQSLSGYPHLIHRDIRTGEVNKYGDRSAQVVCNIVYYDGENTIVGAGILEGFISKECRGNNGFGFDEIFELPNGLTLAEISPKEKNEISARSLALKDLRNKINVLKK